MKYILVTLLFLLVGCNASFSSKSVISLNGSQSTGEKLRVAEEIIYFLWEGDLKPELKIEFDGLENVNLDKSLGLRYFKTTFTPFDESKKPRDVVSISCIFKSKDKELNQKVADFCISKIKNLLDTRGIKYEM